EAAFALAQPARKLALDVPDLLLALFLDELAFDPRVRQFDTGKRRRSANRSNETSAVEMGKHHRFPNRSKKISGVELSRSRKLAAAALCHGGKTLLWGRPTS